MRRPLPLAGFALLTAMIGCSDGLADATLGLGAGGAPPPIDNSGGSLFATFGDGNELEFGISADKVKLNNPIGIHYDSLTDFRMLSVELKDEGLATFACPRASILYDEVNVSGRSKIWRAGSDGSCFVTRTKLAASVGDFDEGTFVGRLIAFEHTADRLVISGRYRVLRAK